MIYTWCELPIVGTMVSTIIQWKMMTKLNFDEFDKSGNSPNLTKRLCTFINVMSKNPQSLSGQSC